MLKFLLLLLPVISFSQESIPKNANIIVVENVSFSEVAEKLLDAGFSFERVDSNFKTIRTYFRKRTPQSKWLDMRLMVRVKEGKATITGDYFYSLFRGDIENLSERIEYSSGDAKKCFVEMNELAQSFNKPVSYSSR